MSDHQPVVESGNQGFDPSEVDAVTASAVGVVIILIIVAVFIGVTMYWDKFMGGRYREVVEDAPNTQLVDMRKSEAAALAGYSYVDKSKGQVRIPIDRAMELLIGEVKAGKAPYNTKDQAKVADPADAAGAPGAAPAAPAPAAAAHAH